MSQRVVSEAHAVGIQASGQCGLHTGFPSVEWGRGLHRPNSEIPC